MLRNIVLITVALISLGTQCLAAPEHTVVFNVPFAFTFDGKVMPAGLYILDLDGKSAIFKEINAKVGVMAIGPTQRPAGEPPTKGHLHFIAANGTYYLHQMEIWDHQAHLRVPKAIDVKLAKNDPAFRTVTIVGD